MTAPAAPGWVYVLTHPAWHGMVKIGKTGRDPRVRAAEITSVSGLIAPCAVAFCAPVADMDAAEKAVHRMLGDKRVRKRRELFRVDAGTARGVIEAVASGAGVTVETRPLRPAGPPARRFRGHYFRRRRSARRTRDILAGSVVVIFGLVLAAIRFAPAFLR